jgi:hypothetical protein
MGCGCLVALAATLSPRFALFLVWLLTDRTSIAFDSFWIGALGFLFLPWTALAWVVAFDPSAGVSGFGWFVVAFAFVVDVSSHLGGARARSHRTAAT